MQVTDKNTLAVWVAPILSAPLSLILDLPPPSPSQARVSRATILVTYKLQVTNTPQKPTTKSQ